MYSYSIMPLNTDHLEEICLDIKYQYENKIADLALFQMTLVPEGDPVIDKAGIMLSSYDMFKERLSEMGLECGILVQASIGHGWPLDSLFPFRQYVNVSNGEKETSCCPYDEGFREHFKNVMKALAGRKPKMIMIDDDFRLMMRVGKGCACEKHMEEFNRLAGTDMSREELYEHLKGKSAEDKKYRDIFVKTQGDSLIGAIKKMREGIDEVDPSIQGAICMGGDDCEFAEENAALFAGKGNPSIARINNGSYHPQGGAHYFTFPMIRAAKQIAHVRDKIDVFLAETDTCPQNRYSTGAHFLHSHFTGTILEGASGAKHWITKRDNYEAETGKAYRDILSKYNGFYRALQDIVPGLKPIGCCIPITHRRRFYFHMDFVYDISDDYCWSTHVLERLGLPLYFSDKYGGAVFMTGEIDEGFTDKEIENYFKGTLFLASDSLESLNKRGFLKYTGVECREWEGERISGEVMAAGNDVCDGQKNAKMLILKDGARADSYCYHLRDGKIKEKLFPGTAVYKNELGGTVVSFCGIPKTEYHYLEAFSFLCRARKKQLMRLLKETGNLAVCYPGDAEVYLRAAYAGNNEIFCALFNLSYDPLDEIRLSVEKKVSKVEFLNENGERCIAGFEDNGEEITVKKQLLPLTPVILFIS